MNEVAAPVTFRLLGAGDAARGEVLEIATAEHHFGRMAIECSGSALPEHSMPVFRNAVAMLAVILERLKSFQLLADENIRKLQEREASMAEAQRIALIGHWEWDIRTDVIGHSAQAGTNIGLEDPQIRLKEFLDTVHPADRDHVRNALRECVESGTPYKCSFRVVRADKCERFLEAWGDLIRDPDGIPIRMRGVAQDVTERRLLEQQLLQAQKLESVGRLAGGVAHDFNNLLTVINGYSDLARHGLSEDDPLYLPLTEIGKAGARAAGLTKQLLAFSRRQVVEPRAVNINQLITESRAMMARLIGEDIELVTALSDVPDPVFIDAGQLHQVLMNLAVNSRDAMPEGGTLTIGTGAAEVELDRSVVQQGARPGPYVVLTVADTGTGMDEQVRERIFEPFYTTKAPGKGTGLGLSTVYGIVRQAGGWIEVDSRPNGGTTFRIGLPRMAGEDAEEAAASLVPAQRGWETVLVVEDQEDVRRFAATVLKNCGYRVLEAGNGGEALVIAGTHQGPIHLVLADVVMPRMSGKELVERLAANRPNIRALYMSGYAHDMIGGRVPLEPGVHFIHKPFPPDALARKVREALAPPVKKRTVLVADDDGGIRKLFEQVLKAGGYEVISVQDGDEALKMAQQHEVDLLVSDLAMPNGGGRETIRAIRESRPGLKVLIVSGALREWSPEAPETAGADAALMKPVSPDRLLSAVQSLLPL